MKNFAEALTRCNHAAFGLLSLLSRAEPILRVLSRFSISSFLTRRAEAALREDGEAAALAETAPKARGVLWGLWGCLNSQMPASRPVFSFLRGPLSLGPLDNRFAAVCDCLGSFVTWRAATQQRLLRELRTPLSAVLLLVPDKLLKLSPAMVEKHVDVEEWSLEPGKAFLQCCCPSCLQRQELDGSIGFRLGLRVIHSDMQRKLEIEVCWLQVGSQKLHRRCRSILGLGSRRAPAARQILEVPSLRVEA